MQPKPRCISQFHATPTEASVGVANLTYRLLCGLCGKGAFALEQLMLGEDAIGVDLVCEACGHVETVFDGKQHGYDGELGNTEHLSGEPSRHKLLWADDSVMRHERIFAMFVYNVEPGELDELSKESGVAPQDLFDWFNIIEEHPETGETMWDYECA